MPTLTICQTKYTMGKTMEKHLADIVHTTFSYMGLSCLMFLGIRIINLFESH